MTNTEQQTNSQLSTPAPLGGWIVGIALALMVGLPLIAVGAAVAWRLFCLIAGVCG